jgi:hypothetical protein
MVRKLSLAAQRGRAVTGVSDGTAEFCDRRELTDAGY